MSKCESTGSSKMVTNTGLSKKVEDQEEENRQLRERLDQLAKKLEAIEDRTKEVNERIDEKEGKDKVVEDEEHEPNLVVEQEPFLKSLKALSGKSLEGIPLFSGKMEPNSVIDWI